MSDSTRDQMFNAVGVGLVLAGACLLIALGALLLYGFWHIRPWKDEKP